jgi:hypothetical protein
MDQVAEKAIEDSMASGGEYIRLPSASQATLDALFRASETYADREHFIDFHGPAKDGKAWNVRVVVKPFL